MNTLITLTRMHLLTMLLAVAISTMIAVTLLTAGVVKRVTIAEDSAAKAVKHVQKHDLEADEWKKRIVHLESQMERLKTQAMSRPDPFTGTMGKALESRIETIEKALEGLGSATPVSQPGAREREHE